MPSLLDRLYTVSYQTGSWVIDVAGSVKKRLSGPLGFVKNIVKARCQSTADQAGKKLRSVGAEMLEPARQIKRNCSTIKLRVAQSKTEDPRTLLRQCAGELWDTVKQVLRHLVSLLNIVCPIAAFALLLVTISYFNNLTFALKVEYSGQDIGYIKDESVFMQAENAMKERIIFEEYEQPIDTVPRFTLSVVNDTEIEGIDALTDKLIKNSGNVISEASGLYIDDQFMGALEDKNQLLLMLDSLKSPYEEEKGTESVDFVNKVEVKAGLYPTTSIVNLDNVENELTRDVVTQRTYTVQKGDAPILIAKENGISLASLLAQNEGIDKKLLIGQEVQIQGAEPFLKVQTTKQITYTENIDFETEYVTDNKYNLGYMKISQEGEPGERIVTARVKMVNGVETGREVLDEIVISSPKKQIVVKGGSTPSYSTTTPSYGSSSVTGSGALKWPLGGGYVSCGVNGYRGHTGMDIAGTGYGSNIYAADAGTVVVVRQTYGGYGKYVVIDHGNGMQTWYAHCSALYVSVGQQVKTGDVIAAVGATGNAYGNHLHFEVRVNGQYKNPSNYF